MKLPDDGHRRTFLYNEQIKAQGDTRSSEMFCISSDHKRWDKMKGKCSKSGDYIAPCFVGDSLLVASHRRRRARWWITWEIADWFFSLLCSQAALESNNGTHLNSARWSNCSECVMNLYQINIFSVWSSLTLAICAHLANALAFRASSRNKWECLTDRVRNTRKVNNESFHSCVNLLIV